MSDYGVNFNNGSTGGEYSHTLSQQKLPSFNISGNTSWAELQGHISTQVRNGNGYRCDGIVSWESSYGGSGWKSGGGDPRQLAKINASHSHSFNATISGGNRPHNNMQPFLTVYMWKRKA